MNMNSNEKGVVGLIQVVADLYSKGFTCFLPFDDYNPVDCIALNNQGKAFRLQVKYKSPNKHNSYDVAAFSVVNGKKIKINRDLIDFWAIYLADKNKVVYMRVDAMQGKNSKRITHEHIGELDEWIISAPC